MSLLPAHPITLPRSRPATARLRISVAPCKQHASSIAQCSVATLSRTLCSTDSGSAALAVLERDDPCDLVVMDQVMPGLSGRDTVRLARRARPELKVLFVSGYVAWAGAGGDIWLQKPFKTQALAEAVSRALQ